VVYSGSVEQKEDPLIVVQGVDENDQHNSRRHILAFWKLSVFLSRPLRLRLQNPCVVFSASASLKPIEHIKIQVKEDEYLPSQVPSGVNLLESFNNDAALGPVKPRLSALRVSRVIPATQVTKDLIRPLKNISRRSIKVVPAFSARLRYARPNSIPSKPSLIASLDIDVTPFAGPEMVLEKVNFTFSDGIVEDLNTIRGMALPLTCLPRDDITFMYRLLPNGTDSNIKPVQISVTAIVKVSDTSEPHISMQWQTSIDFTLPVNPGFGQPSQAIQRDRRPSQLTLNSTFETIPTIASLAVTRLDTLAPTEPTTRLERSSSMPDFGVTMTFVGTAKGDIQPGEIFTWEVFIVNRSDRPRKLAIIVIPKRRRTERINNNRPPSTSYGRKDPSIADAVIDENILHAMQKNAAIEPADIICFSTDIRVGPLAPAACHTVELRFMALVSGIIALDAVRVIDLGTQEHVDIKDLPSIVVA
jgi:TRAPP trafficking subunit Trs65